MSASYSLQLDTSETACGFKTGEGNVLQRHIALQ